MKFVCAGIDLSDSVLKVVKACASKTTLPVLECIKIHAKNDGVTLTATDGEIAIQKKFIADVYEEGEVCVPGKYFADFIKKLEGVEIGVNVYNNKMELSYADSQSSMTVLPADDFPKIDTSLSDTSFIVKTSDLKECISATSFACASDDSRPILKGCQFVIKGNDLCVTALDGFRLATYSGKVVSSSGDMEIICPARTLNEIEKMLPLSEENTQIYIQKGLILVSVENTILTSRLYNGDFINKDNIIKKDYTTYVTINREFLKSSIERAAILVRNDKNSLIIFDVTPNGIEVSSVSEIGNVQEPIPASVEGKDLKIAMNSKFITEAINALDEEEITLSFNNNVQPFICQNKENKNTLYLILPVRTANNA